MSQSNHQPSASALANSWALTLSQYVLQRRAQTQQAYQAQLLVAPAVNKSHASCDTNHEATDNTLSNVLFIAIFELLVQRLEEGHTVLLLEDTPAQGDTAALTWQQQILMPLFQSLWLPLADVIASKTIDIDREDNQPSEAQTLFNTWHVALRQTTLSEYDRQILQQRYDIYLTVQHYLSPQNNTDPQTINSLSKLKEILNDQPTFQQSNQQTQKIDSPIIFETKEDKNQQTTAITLWLHRTWQAEYTLAQHIMFIKAQPVTKLPITLNPLLNSEQQNAIHMANGSAFSIITGGPGTGKTFTVAQLVIALQQAKHADKTKNTVNNNHDANLALAAPTGKAAQRMQESLQDALRQANVDMQLPEAKTIHRLLGIGQGGEPRYHADNPLSEDIIIIDEASMLGVELANHLVSAIKPNARLILLGDANQLAAVDAGAVLGDLCRIPALQKVHQQLQLSRRFTADSGIGQLARLINQAHHKDSMPEIWQLLNTDKSLHFYHLMSTLSAEAHLDCDNNSLKNSLSNFTFLKKILTEYKSYINQSQKILTNIKTAKSIPTAEYLSYFNDLMDTLNQFKVLTASHHGRCGDTYINQYMSEAHKKQLKLPLSKSPWYHGRPVMILQNNYELGLFNGDIGICMQTDKGRLQVFFENKKQGIAINMFSDDMIATAYAMTIHKSQGSEFEHVAISFDDHNARLLSQELIYTAVTRAKKQVSLYSTASAFTQALKTPTIRQTGLALQFAKIT